ncbi:MAG: hypothetical protein LBE36_07465 [Flavobacteriaceae bacterium]|nr:hypothetical protein [Flavobacteriaceae bacterium]
MTTTTSCRNDSETIQNIDQVLNLYIDSLGQDMLNSQISGSYQTISWNDVYGITDNAPVQFTSKTDADTMKYLEYVAGARRILIDSADENAKIYQSKIELTFTKKITDSTTSTFSEEMIINYVSKPEMFQIQKIWYNNADVFTKTDGQPNIVKITK